MSTYPLTVQQVIDFASARLNDASQTLYTDTVQLPFINIALDELQEIYEANNIPVTDTTSSVIDITAAYAEANAVDGILDIEVVTNTLIPGHKYLPGDLIEIKVAWESPAGLNQWTTMTRLDFLPQYQIGVEMNQFLWYQWAKDYAMRVFVPNADIDIKVDYIRSLFGTISDTTDELLVQNSLSFLGNRVASLIASDIEENQERSNRLYNDALGGLDRALTIPTKGRQRITIRRKPFRAGFKANRQMW